MFKPSISALLLALVLTGCAAAPLAIPIAVSAGGGGVAYTVTNVAYKTVSYSLKKVEAAMHSALRKMAIKEQKRETFDGGIVRITAVTEKLVIYIDLEKITSATTNIKVNAVRSKVLKDKATATEIIVQTEKVLEGENR